MNAGSWLSIVSLLAWLALALSAVRAHRIGARQAAVMGLAWAAIFVFVAAVFAWAA